MLKIKFGGVEMRMFHMRLCSWFFSLIKLCLPLKAVKYILEIYLVYKMEELTSKRQKICSALLVYLVSFTLQKTCKFHLKTSNINLTQKHRYFVFAFDSEKQMSN